MPETIQVKKFLDREGLQYLSTLYPTNVELEAVIDGVQDALDDLETAVSGVQNALDDKIDVSARGAANGVASLDANGKVVSSQLPVTENTTYTLTQDQNDGHIITITGTDGYTNTITIPDEDTTYSEATESAAGLMSATDKTKLDGIAEGATANTGTITGITMNGVSKGTSGVVNLGTVITDVSDKANVSTTVTGVGYDTTNKKITKTIDGTTTDVVTVSTLKSDLQLGKSDVGLGNADNTSDLDKPVSTATQTALNGKLNTSLKGIANGLAELDENGKVPSSQLPSYVDDVLEYSTLNDFPETGEAGKIYVNLSDNETYRWSGTTYVVISPSLALGNTSSTAFRGDYGETAYNHATDASKSNTAYASGLYKIATTAEGHIASATAVVKGDITGLMLTASDVGAVAVSQGTTNAGKFLIVNSSGNVEAVTMDVWQGGDY